MDWYAWVIMGVFIVIVLGYTYIYIVKDWFAYRKARKEIFVFVKSYKRRCTGANRFVVTVEVLQDSFREYDNSIILNVWLELMNERVIEIDPQDQEWCIR